MPEEDIEDIPKPIIKEEPKPEPKKPSNKNIEKLEEIKKLINSVIKGRSNSGQLQAAIKLVDEIEKDL